MKAPIEIIDYFNTPIKYFQAKKELKQIEKYIQNGEAPEVGGEKLQNQVYSFRIMLVQHLEKHYLQICN